MLPTRTLGASGREDGEPGPRGKRKVKEAV